MSWIYDAGYTNIYAMTQRAQIQRGTPHTSPMNALQIFIVRSGRTGERFEITIRRQYKKKLIDIGPVRKVIVNPGSYVEFPPRGAMTQRLRIHRPATTDADPAKLKFWYGESQTPRSTPFSSSDYGAANNRDGKGRSVFHKGRNYCTTECSGKGDVRKRTYECWFAAVA